MSWQTFFKLYGESKIETLISKAYAHPKRVVYPRQEDVLHAYTLTNPDTIKVVIIGQDPYILEGQAHGLAFSIESDTAKVPPTLKNIFKELELEYGMLRTRTNLSDWATQGVFLLNTILTVEAGVSLSHKHVGWQDLTAHTIEYLNQQKQPICYLLLGKDAQKYQSIITGSTSHIITAPHPSPLAAYRGFFGSNIFKEINLWLESNGQEPIQWI